LSPTRGTPDQPTPSGLGPLPTPGPAGRFNLPRRACLLVLLGLLSGPWFARAGANINSLRVLRQSPDRLRTLFLVNYEYDGRQGPSVRLVPAIEKRGQTQLSDWFATDGVAAGPGTRTVTVLVRYLHDHDHAPPTVASDTVRIRLLAGRTLLDQATFERRLTWGQPVARAHAGPAPTPRAAQPKPSRAPEAGPPEAKPAPSADPPRAVAPAAPPPPLIADPAEPAATNANFSVDTPLLQAPWLKHLTLGPGDELNFSLFGHPELTEQDAAIGPDGRVSFLEAQDVPATGLTVDQLRERLDHELAKYRRAPSTIVTPVAFHSKKFFMLGSVNRKGVFTLSHPMTIIEAVAAAHGLATGLSAGDSVELADLSRSFLVRHGRRLPVDFQALFQHGDLSQNIPIQPGDYLYFAPNDQGEVYVLGAVQYPGPVPFTPELTTIAALSAGGGFAKHAWQRRVLVVRGSLNHPQTFVINTTSVLAARREGFTLQPKDIIYVSKHPWSKAEDILDNAATAFVQSAVIIWTGLHVDPLIK
jgi:protein involved in polysaccharide export with SLBB domain